MSEKALGVLNYGILSKLRRLWFGTGRSSQRTVGGTEVLIIGFENGKTGMRAQVIVNGDQSMVGHAPRNAVNVENFSASTFLEEYRDFSARVRDLRR
jgi:hypothetical protein